MTAHLLRRTLAALGAFASLGLAGPAAAIVGGIASPDFDAVGASSNGSAVQITDHWVLTAKHVPFTAGVSTFSNGFGAATVAQVFDVGPGAFPSDDLRLLRLASPIADGSGITLFGTALAVPDVLPPVPVTIVSGFHPGGGQRGYGHTELRETWSSADAGAGPRPVNWLIVYNDTLGEPYVQPGDSGGALFLGHVTDATTPLIGITSARLSGTDPVYGPLYGSAFVQIAAYRSWIDATITGAGFAAPLWISAVPEPATLLLWFVGLVLVVVHARRRRPARQPGLVAQEC